MRSPTSKRDPFSNSSFNVRKYRLEADNRKLVPAQKRSEEGVLCDANLLLTGRYVNVCTGTSVE